MDLKEVRGFDTKEKLSQWIHENTRIRVGNYWDLKLVSGFTLPLAKRGVEPYASWVKLPKDALIPRFPGSKDINIVVVGGETNAFWQAGDFRYIGSALVDAWR